MLKSSHSLPKLPLSVENSECSQCRVETDIWPCRKTRRECWESFGFESPADFREALSTRRAPQSSALFLHPARKVFWNFAKQSSTSYLLKISISTAARCYFLCCEVRKKIWDPVSYPATEVFWLFRQTVWSFTCGFRQKFLQFETVGVQIQHA